MDCEKGSAQGPKKKSSRRSKGLHRARDGESAIDTNTKGKQSSGNQAGTSIPSAGSSGKQAQMVFTIGTFDDDDDDSYISNQLHNTAAASSHIADKKARGNSHTQPRLLGARRSVELCSTAKPTADIRPLLDDRLDSSELPASWKGAGLAKPAAAQRLQLKRQTLFTMGSHSEASDMDGTDIYSGPLHRSAYAAHCSPSPSPNNSFPDSSGVADAVVASNLSRDDLAMPGSPAEQRVPDSGDVFNAGELATDNRAADRDGETHAEGGCNRRNSDTSPTPDLDVACSSNALHMCKASTSLSQLGNVPDTSSSIDVAAASSSASGQGSSSVGVPERVASAPAIQPAVDACGSGSCVSFAVSDDMDPPETSPSGKGKTPMPREGYTKPRKRVASKKPHLKKAVSTAALRARSRHSGPQRRDPLPLRTHTQLNTAAEYDGLADCSYVDYSGNSDTGEENPQAPVEQHQQQQQQPGGTHPPASPEDTTRADQTRASPHSSTATLDGANQDVDDSASTASIDSPRLEQSRTASSNQHPQNEAVASSRANTNGDLTQTTGLVDMTPGSDQLATNTAAGQPLSDNATRTAQRVQGGTPESVVALSTKRNMESQRQQSMVEKEEEDLDIANTLLTGIPRRRNRPTGMAPYIYLNPASPAYSQQVRTVDRTYGHVRTTAHPMLESISRCVALREQRLALATPRGPTRVWSSRRTPVQLSEADLQADWWESLMPPPPPPNLASSRAAPGQSSRLQLAELPPWVPQPDKANCAVYGLEFGQPDPSCVHIRELREHAKELKYVRQHAASAPRNQVLTLPHQHTPTTAAEMETWRGRRVPGLLTVDIYSGAAGPLEPGARQAHWPAAEPRSSPSPEPMLRGNPLAPPYRRYGTVYGYTSKAASVYPGQAVGLSAIASGGGRSGHGSVALNARGFDSASATRPSTVGIWDSDPRRSSYFDRLSIDETRPQLASSAAQTTTAGLLRRVISGLTGGTAAFGTSQ
ncbi:hypothetical protein GGI20_001552 [Coemansia sp. BCRC 34301]|nr:hypothetical protein GGI20_001552 [Coemansia sp. BCRC 34301]